MVTAELGLVADRGAVEESTTMRVRSLPVVVVLAFHPRGTASWKLLLSNFSLIALCPLGTLP
jgi:hypothetical protein